MNYGEDLLDTIMPYFIIWLLIVGSLLSFWLMALILSFLFN